MKLSDLFQTWPGRVDASGAWVSGAISMEPSQLSASSESKSSIFSCSAFGCICLGDATAAGWGLEAGAGRAAAVR